MSVALRYLISLLLILSFSTGFSQSKWAPKTVRVGYDVSSLVVTLIEEDQTYFEINGDIDFHRYFISMDYGYQEKTRTGEDFIYNNSGSFFRIGPDVNFNHLDRDNSTFFLGARYAFATFKDDMQYIIDDPVFGPASGQSSNTGVNASWLELVSGIKVRVWRQWFLGYTVRFKFARSQDLTPELAPFEVPGYGKVSDNSTWGFNYSIYYRFKFKPGKLVSEEEIKNAKKKKN